MRTFPSDHLTKSGQFFQIRNAEPTDAKEILDFLSVILAEGEFTLTLPEELPHSIADEASWILSMNEKLNAVILLAILNGKIIGVLDFTPGNRKRNAHQGEFGISITQEFRNAGIGAHLMNRFLTWAQDETSLEKINLRVHAENPRAIHLYQKLNFEIEGKQIRAVKFGSNHYADSLLMGKFLIRAAT